MQRLKEEVDRLKHTSYDVPYAFGICGKSFFLYRYSLLYY